MLYLVKQEFYCIAEYTNVCEIFGIFYTLKDAIFFVKSKKNFFGLIESWQEDQLIETFDNDKINEMTNQEIEEN